MEAASYNISQQTSSIIPMYFAVMQVSGAEVSRNTLWWWDRIVRWACHYSFKAVNDFSSSTDDVWCTRDTAVCEICRDMNRFHIVLIFADFRKNHCPRTTFSQSIGLKAIL